MLGPLTAIPNVFGHARGSPLSIPIAASDKGPPASIRSSAICIPEVAHPTTRAG